MIVLMYNEYQITAFQKCINDLKSILTENYDLIKDSTIILDSTWDLLSVDLFVDCLLNMKCFDYDKIIVHQAANITKHKNFKTFYTALSNQFCWYDTLQNENIDWKNILVDKHIVALVRRPTVFRAEFIKTLLDALSTNTRASFGNMDRPEHFFTKYKEILRPYPVPLMLDVEHLDLISATHSPKDYLLYKNLCNVVIENSIDFLYVTEKTYKAFAWHQVPIFFAATGHVEQMRKLGFDVFDDLLGNHSYDNETNNHVRKLKVISTLSKFVKNNPDINELREKIFHRFESNNKRLSELVEEERLRFDPKEHLDQLKLAGLQSFI